MVVIEEFEEDLRQNENIALSSPRRWLVGDESRACGDPPQPRRDEFNLSCCDHLHQSFVSVQVDAHLRRW